MNIDEQIRVSTDIDPFARSFLTSPYAKHAELRALAPVVWFERYGVWGAARFAEVKTALADWQTFCSGRGVGIVDTDKATPWRPRSIILEQDPPIHTRTRTVLTRVLSPRAIQTLRETMTQFAAELVDKLVEQREIDGVIDLAEAFPLRVFPDAVGLTRENRQLILEYSNMAFNGYGPPNDVFEESVVNIDAVLAWVTENCRREALAPGGFGAQIFDAVDAGELSEEEAQLLIRSFLTAGVDTTVNGMGNSLYCFARYPEQWEKLRSDRSGVRAAFDEVVRLESPVQTFFRTVTKDVELGGRPLREGDKIILFLGAANRDERQFANPDVFDISRRPTGHVAFGHGIHGCVGQSLARLETEIVLTALLDRVERFEITGEPVARPNNTLKGLASLPMRITPAH